MTFISLGSTGFRSVQIFTEKKESKRDDGPQPSVLLPHHLKLALPSLPSMLLFLLLPLLGLASLSSASQYLNSDGGVLHNRELYSPSRRLTSDEFPLSNSNVSFISKFSKPKTTGLTNLVAWDRYSLYVKGQRIFVYSGEFHLFRLPSIDLWFDIIQKAKAAGNNAISIYVAWNQLNPSEGVLDMDGYRNLQPFFDQCKKAGVFVIARPGPFVNAETTGGGIPGWVIRKKGDMRTNSTDYFASWQQYVDEVTQLIAKNQISEGGPVILVQVENEFTTGVTYTPHMEELKEAFRRNGIVVPLTFNNPTGKGNFASGAGAVDIAGLDAYPAGFTCRPDYFAPLVTTFPLWSERVNRDAPYYFAEIQGGSFDPWGNTTLGYEACYNMTSQNFERVHTQYLLENRVTMINKYMWYGGTNWGGIAAPVVYTSYDYGTYVKEDRRLTNKYSQYKLLGLFLRNTPAIRQTEVVGYFGEFSQYSLKNQPYIGRPVRNGTFYTSDSNLWTTELRNPDSLSAFYLVRQATWATNISESFSRSANLSIWTPDTGDLVIPQFGGSITIGGRDSRIIPTDLVFGSTHLRYSTAAVLFGIALGDDKDLIIFYGEVGQSFEAVFAGLGTLNASDGGSAASVKTFASGQDLVLTFLIPSSPINVAFQIGSLTVLILDTPTAYTVWQPTISEGDGDFSNFAEVGTNSSVVVVGPYLVRNASLSSSTLSLFGDIDKKTSATVYTPSEVTSVTWNGAVVDHVATATGISIELEGPESSFNFTPPALTKWKYHDSLPEIQLDFDDSSFTSADHTSTNATTQPLNGSVALSATDYGFVTGNILWRGRFDGDSHLGVTLNVTGGLGFGFSAWVGQTFLGSAETSKFPYMNANFTFPAGSLSSNTTNILTIIQDHMGLDEDTALDKASKNNRGITSINLLGPSPVAFSSWKVQGNRGGEVDFPDKTRGILNEGGLFGEREGYHLPGFDDSAWNSTSSVQIGQPGVGFFRTTFELDIEKGYDVALSFAFEKLGGKHRALLFVNGWQFGKFAGSIGPQLVFPVPEGILDYHGTNTVALAFWAYGTDAIDLNLGGLKLVVDNVVKGGVGHALSQNPEWVPRT